MAAIQLPKGLIVDMITPLSKNGEIDGIGLERHVKGLIPHVQAIFLAGPYLGEGAVLSPEQREAVFHRTLLIVESRLPILVWISGTTIEETERMLLLLKKRIEILRYTGPVFWVDTPLYYHSNRGLEISYKRISSLVEEPFILVNDPAFIKAKDQPLKRVNIRTSILKGLASMDNIKGLIFLGSLDRAYNYRKAVRSSIDFMIYDGDESHFLQHPSLNGVLSRGANLAPAAWKTITASSLNLNGNLEDYPDRMGQILGAGRYVNDLKNIYQGHSAIFFKKVLSELGTIENQGSSVESGKNAGDVKKIIELMEERRNYAPFKTQPL
jgi:dihydrodipicolinate synthase/N-acetylneuraminate lyase